MFRLLRRPLSISSSLVLVTLALTQAGCGNSEARPVSSETSKLEVAENDSAAGRRRSDQPFLEMEPTEQPRKPIENQRTTPSTAPDGRLNDAQAKALLADIRNVQQKFQQSSFSTQEEVAAALPPLLEEIIEKAGRIVAADANSKTRIAAAEMKLGALSIRRDLLQEDSGTEVEAFCRTLQRDRSERLAGMGDRFLFMINLGKALEAENPDISARHDELAKLIRAVKDVPQEANGFIAGVMGLLEDKGLTAELETAALVIADELQHSQDPQMIQFAANLRNDARQMRRDSLANAVVESKEGAVEELAQWIRNELAATPLDDSTVQLTTQAAQTLETTGHYTVATEIFEAIETAFRDHPDPHIVEGVALRIDLAKRRLGLIGKPLEVTGVLLDGGAFDWSQYDGQVVLVEFWISSFRMWWAERVPELYALRQKYEEQGLEVIGINLDDDPAAAATMLQVEKLPWPTLVGPSEDKQGKHNPFAVQCGVEWLPYNVLINREGIVVAIHVQGAELDKQVAKLLDNGDGVEVDN